MFIELHERHNNSPVMIHISDNMIVSISGGSALITIKETQVYVKESYEQVKSLLDVVSLG